MRNAPFRSRVLTKVITFGVEVEPEAAETTGGELGRGHEAALGTFGSPKRSTSLWVLGAHGFDILDPCALVIDRPETTSNTSITCIKPLLKGYIMHYNAIYDLKLKGDSHRIAFMISMLISDINMPTCNSVAVPPVDHFHPSVLDDLATFSIFFPLVHSSSGTQKDQKGLDPPLDLQEVLLKHLKTSESTGFRCCRGVSALREG